MIYCKLGVPCCFGTVGFCLTIACTSNPKHSLCRPTPAQEKTMEFRKTSSLAEAFICFRLVVHSYQQRGYLPNTKTVNGALVLLARFIVWVREMVRFKMGGGYVFVAKDKEKILGTIMVYFSPKKIPLFGKEFAELRAKSSKIAYLGSFATIESCKCTRTSLKMMQEVKKELLARGIESALCIVHPDHVGLYKRYGFVTKASRKAMPGLKNAPAVLIAVHKESVTI